MTNENISPITENDFDELINLFREFSFFERTPEKMTNSKEKMINEKEFIHGFIARDANNEIMGYATCCFTYHTWVGKSLYMDDLYVKENHRGKGIGSKLIKKVISFAKEEKCNRLRWQVSNWNASAIEFYKKIGADINDVQLNCDLVLTANNNI